MSETLTLIVISDLHCRPTESANGVTRLCSDQSRVPIVKHPVAALKKLIEEKSLKADIILCPGDITDKANNQGFLSGWDFLKDIKLSFGAKYLFATLGNHDIKSRGEEFPFKFAQNLESNFPFEIEEANKEYWSSQYALIIKENALFLIFNSCYTHVNEDKAKKCEIEESILESIQLRLEGLKDKYDYKIAMCHHHPINHYNRDYPDEDLISNGDRFVKLLDRFNFQILIHGHKHDPRLTPVYDLPILASASFSALTNLQSTDGENMFHIITLKKGTKYGTIKSYVYKSLQGWITYTDNKFPFNTGFGYTGDLNDLAKRCNEWFIKNGQGMIPYTGIASQFAEVEYLTPDKQEKFDTIMRSEYNLEFSPALSKNPKYLVKPYG